MPIIIRLLNAGLIGFAGAATMAAMSQGFPDPAMIIAAFVGAALMGIITAPLFGHPHGDGSAYAIGGALVATIGGAALAGLVVGLPIGFPGAVLMAPVFVGAEIIRSPITAATWIASMALTHAVMWLARSLWQHPAYSRK